MKTLEDILKKYKFASKSKQLFRKRRIWVDDVPDDMTRDGHRAYRELICLLYDICNLCNEDKNKNFIHGLVDELDRITTEQY